MTDSSDAKIIRALEHIEELGGLLQESPPFSYVLETDTRTGLRATRPEKNESVVVKASVIAGDAIHNLRAALDHTYWSIVRPVVGTAREAKSVQFPFSESADRLREAVSNRLAQRVSTKFFDAIMSLAPHGEAGGNELLYLIHEADIIDKHQTLTPAGDYTELSSDLIRAQVPDFPSGLSNVSFGSSGAGDVAWSIPVAQAQSMGLPGIPAPRKLKQKLDVPVQIVFRIRDTGPPMPFVPTLHRLSRVAQNAVEVMRNASA